YHDAIVFRCRGRHGTIWCSAHSRASGSLACEPVAWNRPLGSLAGKLAMNDGAAGRRLHRKPGIVLGGHDRTWIDADPCLPGHDIVERVDVRVPDQAFLEWLE